MRSLRKGPAGHYQQPSHTTAGRIKFRFRPRGGFTLIELLVVIAIIALLIGLLLPAIAAVRNNVRVAQVRTEISDLDAALANFKAKFGMFPPSSIRMSEEGGAWEARSQAFIRRMWPQCNFDIDRDFDGDGTSGEADPDADGSPGVDLFGSECLVFFLGGVRDSNDALVGFSKNPARPFTTGGNREGPFFEFDLTRVKDSPDVDNAVVYIDPLPGQSTTKPYLYVSSYDGRGYLTGDLGGNMTAVYRTGSAAGAAPFKSNSYQIISPGFDAEYGNGGLFDPESASSDLSGTREEERDNITNFHTNMLAP